MKVTKKLLSVFLAVLMAMSCCVAAFPTVASAAASAGQWNQLKIAVQNAGDNLKTANYTKSGGTGDASRTITDKSSDGSVYNVILKLYDCINGEMGKSNSANYSYPSALINRMKSEINSKLGSAVYTGNAKTALDDLVTYIISHNGFSYNKDNKRNQSKTFSYPDNLGDISNVTVTVKRTRAAAVISYGTISAVPDSVETSFSFNLNNATQNDKSSSGFLGATKKLSSWYYFNGMSLTRNVSTEATNISILKTYLNYFTKALITTDPFADYSYETIDDLKALIGNNTKQQTALSDAVSAKKLDNAVIDFFAKKQYVIDGVSYGTNKVDSWCQECVDAADYFIYVPYVEWLNENIITLDSEKLKNVDSTYLTYEKAKELYETGSDKKSAIDASSQTVKTLLNERNNYDAKKTEEQLANLKFYLECLELAKLKAEIDENVETFKSYETFTDEELSFAFEQMKGYCSIFDDKVYAEEAVNFVFKDGTKYIYDMRDALDYEMTKREAENVFQGYFDYFQSKFAMDLVSLTNDQIKTRIDEDTPKFNEYKADYEKYRKLLKNEDLVAIFDGYGTKIQEYIDSLYLRLKTNLRNGLDLCFDYWNLYNGQITLNNFALVKGAVGKVKNGGVFEYLDANNPSLLDSKTREDYARLDSFIQKYDQFVASKGLADFKHLKDYNSKGIFEAAIRKAMASDLGRGYAANPEDDTFYTTTANMQSTIDQLDAFLSSDDFTGLLGQLSLGENEEQLALDDFILKTLGENLFTDEILNMLVAMVFPMLDEQLNKMLTDLTSTSISVGPIKNVKLSLTKSVRQLGNELGIGIYPEQVNQRITSKFPDVKRQLSKGNEWRQVLDADKKFVAKWGLEDIKLENYSSYTDWFNAKSVLFKEGLSQILSSLDKVLRGLLCDQDITLASKIEDVAKAKWGKVSIKAQIRNFKFAPAAGYSNILVPIFETLGISQQNGLRTYSQMKNVNSTSGVVDAILDPLISWIYNDLTKKPISTLLDILPNLLYFLSFDAINDLMNGFETSIKGSVRLDYWGLEEINVYSIDQKLNVGELIGDIGSLIKDFDIGDINSIANYLIGTLMPDMAGLSLPVIDSGKVIQSSELKRNYSSLRADGKERIYFEADKPQLLYVLLNYVCRALGDEAFVKQIFGKDGEVSEIASMLVDTVKNNPDKAVAAIVELLNSRKYESAPYTWWQKTDKNSSIPGASASAYVYLKYGNDWTYDKANTLYNSIDTIVDTLLKDVIGKNGYEHIGEWISAEINNMFDNDAVTSIVKLLAKLGQTLDNDTIKFILSRFGDEGLDLSKWANDFAYLFVTEEDLANPDFVAPLKPGDVGYAAQMGDLTARVNPDRTEDEIARGKEEFIWTYKGKDLPKEEDRAQFSAILGYVLEPLAPAIDVFLSGEDARVLNVLTIQGNNGYDTALIPLFEAFTVPEDKILSQEEFDALGTAQNKLSYLIETAFAFVDSLSEGGNFIQNVSTRVLPSLVYFLQSNGLSVAVRNLIQPLLIILDTAAPIISLDVDALLNELLGGLVKDIFPDAETPTLTVKDLSFHAIADLVNQITGLDISGLTYGVDTICSVDNEEVASKSAKLGYKRYTFVDGTGEGGKSNKNDPANSLTVLFSLVLDLVMADGNAEILDKLIFKDGDGIIELFVKALRSADINPDVYRAVDWFYFNDLYTDDSEKLDYTSYNGENIVMPAATNLYIRYANDLGMNSDNLWSEELADFLDKSLADIADTVIASATEYDSLKAFLDSFWKDGSILYTEKMVATVGAAIGNIIPAEVDNFAELLNVFLKLDVHYWDKYDPETASEEVISQEQFAKEFAEIFAPVDELLSWLFTGKDFKFFYNSNDGEDQIIIAGGEGYNTTLVPILEALGCELPALTASDTGVSILEKVVNSALNRVNGLLGAEKPVDAILDILPNIIYFLNANGLSTSVLNLLAPVLSLVEEVAPKLLKLINKDGEEPIIPGDKFDAESVGALLDKLTGLPVSHLDFMSILGIVKDKLGLDIPSAVTMTVNDGDETFTYNYLENFYIGSITPYVSANGSWAFKMGYDNSADVRQGRADLITILLYTVCDVFYYEGNAAFFEDIFGGAEKFAAIKSLLRTKVTEYEGMDWFYFDNSVTAENFLDGNTVAVDPAKTTMAYLLDTYLQYSEDNIWSADTAKAFKANFYKIVDMIISAVAGDNNMTASAYIKQMWDGANLYSKQNVYAVGKAIGEAMKGIDANYRDILGVVLDVDMTSWDEYINTDVSNDTTVYSKDRFVKELVKVFAPFGKILDWLLVGEDKAISIFFTNDNQDAISVGGSNGYAKAIIPILEALDCEIDANVNTGKDAIEATLNSLLNKVDAIVNSENAVEEIVNLLPNLIYFINANGLSTSVLNLAAPLTNVLENVAAVSDGIDTDLNKLLGLGAYGIDIYKLDLTGVCNIVYNLLGIDIVHAVSIPATDSDGNYVVDADGNMVFNPSYLESFAIGEVVQYISANGDTAYKMQYSEDNKALDALDMFTILVCSAIDVFKFPGNAEFFSEKLGKDKYEAVLALMNSTVDPDTYAKFDWFYFDKDINKDSFAADGAAVPVSYAKSTMGYLKYNNLWNVDSATFIKNNFYDIVDEIIKASTDYDTLAEFIQTEWTSANLYSKKNVYAVGKLVGENIAKLDDTLKTVVGVVLGVDVSYWDVYVNTVITDENNETYTKEQFTDELLKIFEPAKKILDWILVGEDNSLKFFYGKDGKSAVEIGGGNGFEQGLIPLAEALGCTIPAYAENIDSIEALRITINALLARVDGVVNSAAPAEEVIALLPNLIYFINANGLSVAVRNLIAPVVSLLENVSVLTGDDYSDLNSLFGLDKLGIDIYNLDIVNVLKIVEHYTDMTINDAVTYEGVNIFEAFAVGEVERYTSANGSTAYRMKYSSDPNTLSSIDMLTIVVSSVISIFAHPDNEPVLREKLGDQACDIINNILALKKDAKYLNYRWLFTKNNYTEIADEWVDKVASPLQSNTSNFDYSYDEYWTREKAQDVAGHLNDFINELMRLLGIRINGVNFNNIGDVVNQLVGTSLYTQSNINKIAQGLCKLLDAIKGADKNDYIMDSIKAALGTDLRVYEQYRNGKDWGFEDGNRQGFTNALVELLRPLYPVLKVVLLKQDLSLFNNADGSAAVTVPGGNGYAEAVIPVLEALDRNSPSIKTPEQYFADCAADEDAMLTDILNPVMDFIDYVLADPLNRILEVLPGIIYFINSKGLDTAFKNLLHPVYLVLTAIEPVAKVDLYKEMGFDLETMDFEKLYSMLLDKLGDMGVSLKPLVGSAVQELTLGKMVAFTSKNGKKAFTMDYANDKDSLASNADMLTTVLRLALKWVTEEENAETIRAAIRKGVSEDNVEYVIALYDTFVEYAKKDHGINMILGALYYVYVGIDKGTEGTLDWFDDTNGKWKFVMGLLGDAESDYLKGISGILNTIFKKTEDVVDGDGIASSGLVPFFQKIINWFKMIIAKIKALFTR